MGVVFFFWPFSLLEMIGLIIVVWTVRSTALCHVSTFVNVQSPLSQQSDAAIELLEIHWGIWERGAIILYLDLVAHIDH